MTDVNYNSRPTGIILISLQFTKTSCFLMVIYLYLGSFLKAVSYRQLLEEHVVPLGLVAFQRLSIHTC